jgi:hypothetical protein
VFGEENEITITANAAHNKTSETTIFSHASENKNNFF